jgi:hypothetical protein
MSILGVFNVWIVFDDGPIKQNVKHGVHPSANPFESHVQVYKFPTLYIYVWTWVHKELKLGKIKFGD